MGLWLLLTVVKCNNMVMAHLLINHGTHIHQQNCKRSELHTLAKTQKGPYPDVQAYYYRLTIQAVTKHTHTHTHTCTHTTAHTPLHMHTPYAMSNSCW
jgi:hypothetical protein